MKKVLLSVCFIVLSGLCAAETKEFLTVNAFADGRWDEVIKLAGQWKESEPSSSLPCYFAGWAYFASYNFDPGYKCRMNTERDDPGAKNFLPLAEEMVKDNPDNSYVLVIAGSAFARAGKFGLAEEELKRAIKLNPSLGVAYFALGNALKSMGKEKKAADFYKKGISKDPKFLPNYEKLGLYYYSLGKKGKGERTFKKGIRIGGGRSAFLYTRLGEICLAAGEYNKAIENLEKSLKINPGKTPVILALGEAYKLGGRIEKAEKLYRKSLEGNLSCCESLIRGRLSRIAGSRRKSE